MTPRARLALTLIAMALTMFGAGTVSAADHQISWILTSFPDLNIEQGETVTFNFSTGHTVFEFPDQAAFDACDFTSAAEIALVGPVTVPFDEAGTRYFGCDVGSHCSSFDMKIKVITEATSIFSDDFESGDVDAWGP